MVDLCKCFQKLVSEAATYPIYLADIHKVRERQSAASLGLPSRIRDEDCDIETLTAADLEAPDVDLDHPILAPTKPEHITYAIKMVEVSRLSRRSFRYLAAQRMLTQNTVGRIIDLHFVPGRTGSKAKDVESLDNALEAWKDSLPQSMRFLSDETNTSVWACLLHLAYKYAPISPSPLQNNVANVKIVATFGFLSIETATSTPTTRQRAA